MSIIILLIILISFAGCSDLITGKAVFLPKNDELFQSKHSDGEIWFNILNNNTFTNCIATLDTININDNKIINSSTVKIEGIIPDQKVNGIFHYKELAFADYIVSYSCS